MARGKPRVQIIGLGSPHGADRLGWLAIEGLRECGFATTFPPGQVQLQGCPSPAHLPALIQPGTVLLLIDALQGRPLGEVSRLSWQELRQAPVLSGSHGLGLREMLPLVETLYDLLEPVLLFGIGMGEGAAIPLDGLPADLLPRLEKELLLTLAGLHVLPCDGDCQPARFT